MKLQYTIGLVIICLILVVYVIMFERSPIKEPEPGGEAEKIVTFAPAELKEITLNIENKKVTLKRTKDSWEITEPFQAPADPGRVTTVIDRLMDWKSERLIESSVKATQMEEFGMNKPALVIKPLWSKERVPQEIIVGKQTPTVSGYYVMPKPGSKVYTANMAIIDDLLRLVNDPPKASIVPSASSNVKK